MKLWKWFVGQVTRLRRSIVGVSAPDAERRVRADDHVDVADEPAAGPPEHWVARVRRGAPGLLEPSLRRRSEPTGPPVDERVVASQTEREPPPDPLEEPERQYVPPEPPIRPRRPAPARAPLLRKVLRRRRSPSAFPPAAVDTSPPTAERIPDELHAATRRASEPADSPAGEPLDRRRLVDETEPTPARRSLPRTDLAERSPQRSEVVEFEAPAQRRTSQVERAESPVQQIRAEVARPSAANVRQAELAVDEIGPDRVWEPAVPSPAPKRESNVERLREPAVRRPASQRESSAEPGPSPRTRAEPLSAVDPHPWPELPPPIEQVDDDGEATLRAWEHQQRIDHEQTRL